MKWPLRCTQAVLGSFCWWRSGSLLVLTIVACTLQPKDAKGNYFVSSVPQCCMMFCFVSHTCETLEESFCTIHTKPTGNYQPLPQRSKHKTKQERHKSKRVLRGSHVRSSFFRSSLPRSGWAVWHWGLRHDDTGSSSGWAEAL